MESREWQRVPEPSNFRGTLVVSAVRFLCESLIEILGRLKGVRCDQAATLDDALHFARLKQPAIILMDVAFPDGIQAAMQIVGAVPQANLIVLGISETSEHVLAWAEAGITGYVPNTASVDDLTSLVEHIASGEQTCPSHIAGSLLRRVAASRRNIPPPLPQLSRRELEVLRLIAAGLSNKDIARRLGISLGTSKCHVHSLLSKLSLQRRTDIICKRICEGLDLSFQPVSPDNAQPFISSR